MKRDVVLTQPLTSSFLASEKDTELIINKLFVQSRPYSDTLKKLLVVQNKDCLDINYDISNYSVAKLIQDKYIVTGPKIILPEHDELKAFICLDFDGFTPNGTNPKFRDCMVHIDVVCHNDYVDLGNFRQRPIKILGYIDGILNGNKLTNIGTLNFGGCTKKILNEDWTAYLLMYLAIHSDRIPNPNEE